MKGIFGAMLSAIQKALSGLSPVASTIVTVAIMLFAGFLMTRIAKPLRIPNVSAYIIAGILIGPFVLNLVPAQIIDGMAFVPDIALAFIAFSTGEFFRFSVLKQSGAKTVVIMVMEASMASVLVFVLAKVLLGLPFPFAIILAALASVSSLTSTMMTIRQTGAKGDFVTTILQVVALDNIFSLFAYGIAISIATTVITGTNSFRVWDILRPILVNLAVMLVGCGFGVLMKWLMPKKRTTDNRLIISVAILFSFCGICSVVNVSPLLGCMAMGTVYINISDDENLFKQLNYFSPPLLLLYFVRSGASLNMNVLFGTNPAFGAIPLIFIGVFYLIVRVSGKYLGAFLGSLTVGKKKKTRNFLGLALVPQSSVAIGLATLGARSFEEAGYPEMGAALLAVILAASVLHELVGPSTAKAALYLSGSYSDKLEELAPVAETTPSGEQKSEVELLIERIRIIQTKLPEPNINAENEKAFTEAANEQLEAMMARGARHRRINRR